MKNKICLICLKSINVDKDSYVHLIDYREGKFDIEGFYHNKCWHDKFSGKEDVQKAKLMLNNLMGQLEKTGLLNSSMLQEDDK